MSSSSTRLRPGKDTVTPRISYLVRRLERRVRAELDKCLSQLGVATNEYTTLSVLAVRPGLSSAQLARRAFVSAQAMNQVVTSLERRGWIERTSDPDRARVLRTVLTRQGRAVLADCDRATRHVERILLSRLTDRQAEALRETLGLCSDALFEASPASDSIEDD